MTLGEAAALAGWATGRFLAKPNLSRTADLFSAFTELGVSGARALTLLRRRQVITRTFRAGTGQWIDQLDESLLSRAACGENSPWQSWARPWDGQWRVLCFDIPTRPAARRRKLLRFLHQKKFGLLQKSVWISPDHQPELSDLFRAETEAHSLLIWQATTPAGMSAIALAQQAWNFEEINQAYQKVLQDRDGGSREAQRLLEVTRLWHQAVQIDPLLPRRACPKDYLGFQAAELMEKAWSKFRRAGT